MKTAVIYTRVSSEEQVSGTSLDSQLNDCLQYAMRNGFAVVQTFQDAGFSAKTADRPALQAAMAYCLKEKPSAFIVWKLDRLSRKTSDGLVLRATLKKAGTDVLSATEGVTQDAVGELVSTLLLSVAQFDNQQRAARCRRGMVETAMRGGWCHKAPVGFRRAKSPDGLPILEITPEGEVLRNALKALAAGAITKAQYYATCASIGIPDKLAVKIPGRPVYAGLIVGAETGGQPVPAAFPGLITEDERRAILGNKRRQVKLAQRPDYHGLLTCAECGTPLSAYTVKGKYLYYKCRNGHLNVRDSAVHGQISEMLNSIPAMMKILARTMEIFRERTKDVLEQARAEKAAHQARIAQARKRLDRLTDSLVDGKIDDETYSRRAEEYRRTISESNSIPDSEFRVNQIITKYQETVEKLSSPAELLLHLPPPQQQQLLRLIFGAFEVTSNKSVTPTSNYPEPTLLSALSPIKSTPGTKKDGSKPASSSNSLLWWTIGAEGLTRLEVVVGVMERMVRVLEVAG